MPFVEMYLEKEERLAVTLSLSHTHTHTHTQCQEKHKRLKKDSEHKYDTLNDILKKIKNILKYFTQKLTILGELYL